VRAYIAAINGHRYARAWRLGGRNTGGSYPGFVSGFTGTATDTLTILSVSGHVVTARLTARQTDGTVDTYQGTHTVHHGVITGFDVIQLSGARRPPHSQRTARAQLQAGLALHPGS
jgi:hypothetical protein